MTSLETIESSTETQKTINLTSYSTYIKISELASPLTSSLTVKGALYYIQCLNFKWLEAKETIVNLADPEKEASMFPLPQWVQLYLNDAFIAGSFLFIYFFFNKNLILLALGTFSSWQNQWENLNLGCEQIYAYLWACLEFCTSQKATCIGGRVKARHWWIKNLKTGINDTVNVAVGGNGKLYKPQCLKIRQCNNLLLLAA